MIDVINKDYTDVIVAHSPLYQVLDLTYSNDSIGNTVLTTALDYKVSQDMCPKYYFCGHDHEGAGIKLHKNMLCINSATTQNIIEI